MTSLLKDESFIKSTIPFLKSEYFHDRVEKIVFGAIIDYVNKYNSNPTADSLVIELNEKSNIGKEFDQAVDIINEIDKADFDYDEKWLIDTTEKFCQDKAIYNSIMESIEILDGKTKKDKGSIPSLLTEALSVSFDSHIGHDYLEDASERYEYYRRKEDHIPFDLTLLNDFIEGGLTNKTLNVLMASPVAGKTLSMCHMASSAMSTGYTVLYIKLYMS